MPKTLLIRVEFEDDSDFDFLRVNCVGAVEDVTEDPETQERLDGKVEVSWDVEDEDDA